MKLFSKLNVISIALASIFLNLSIASADTKLSIGSCPIGCTAYTWSAGIADVINNNVSGVSLTAEETKGYVANIKLLQNKELEISMATTLSSYQAYAAEGPYKGTEKGKILSWMGIAPVAMHIITLEDSGINTMEDLKGKRVSLDEPGSGTYVDALLILEANGLSEKDVKAEALKGNAATDALRNKKVDAIFVVAGFPTGAIVELASSVPIKLVPIDGAGAKKLTDKYGFFSQSDIPSGTYENVKTTSTVAVGAQWFTSAKEDKELIYNITKALWNKESRKLMDVGHAKGKTITPETALSGVGVPLHPGAEKFYKEAGLIK